MGIEAIDQALFIGCRKMRNYYAFICRIFPRGLFAAFSLGAFQLAHAGYANLAPPAGFSGSPGAWLYQAPANAPWLNGTARAGALLNSAGRAITIPVAFRFAANASRFATGFAFSHPLILGAAALAALSAAKISWTHNGWIEIIDSSTVINEYNTDALNNQWFSSQNAACEAIVASYSSGNRQVTFVGIENNRCKIEIKTPHQYFPGEYYYQYDYWIINTRSITSPSAIEKDLPTEEEFSARAGRVVTPENLPDFAPNQPLPVIQPIINPDDSPVPMPSPMVIPQGEPSLVPNTNPQQYRTPVVEVVPAPTADSPWRVDIQPKDVVRNNPSPVTAPDPTDPTAQDQTQEEKTPGLCDQYPEILACQKPDLDTPDSEIPKSEFSLTYSVSEIIGSGGACPAPVYVSVGSQTLVAWDWPLYCGWIVTYARPVMLSVAAFMSLMIVAGGFKTE